MQFWGTRQHLNACLSLCCGPGRKFWRGEGWVGAGLQLQSASEAGGGGAFPSAGLPVFSEHLPWARLQLLASGVERNEEGLLGTPEGLGGQRRLPHEEQPVQRAWGQEEHSGESLAGLELGDWRAGWDAAAGCGGG